MDDYSNFLGSRPLPIALEYYMTAWQYFLYKYFTKDIVFIYLQVGASLRVPIEIVKQRKQVSLKPTSAISMVRTILRLEGIRGMYRG